MKRKRAAATRTFLIAAMGRDAEKRDAGERVIAWLGGPSLTEEDRATLDAELGLPALVTGEA